ncbi:MAG: YihY/virulence factor BrkB family protein [Rubripirellula sp.]|nr:YihY/virulence factor BrkB family protein [Rubripirellula sp.]
MKEQENRSGGKLSRFIEGLERREQVNNRWIQGLLRACVLAWFCWRQLRRHRAEGMAAELTYRTVFSLIPVLVLGLVLFRVFGGLTDVQTRVESQLYDFFGVPDVVPAAYQDTDAIAPTDDIPSGIAEPTVEDEANELNTGLDNGNVTIDLAAVDEKLSDETETNEAERVEDVSTDETRNSIRRRMREITHYVAAIDFRSIGVIGLLVFVYAAVALANTTEQLFNKIFDVTSHRPFHLRLAIHWSMITLGSALLAMSLFMSSEVIEWSGSVGATSTTQQSLRQFLSFAAAWILLFLLYSWMPNLKVSLRAAATGSLVSAIFWELGKYGFQIYIVKAVPYSAIYGSIGLLPLFLLWVYLTWWIVLFGLILTQTLQSYSGQPLVGLLVAGRDQKSFPAEWLLPTLFELASAFASGRTLTAREIGRRLSVPTEQAARLGKALVHQRFANEIDTAEQRFSLAKPAENIVVQDVVAITASMSRTRQHPAWTNWDDSITSVAHERSQITLAQLLESFQKTNEH